jgi:hypothetical protein
MCLAIYLSYICAAIDTYTLSAFALPYYLLQIKRPVWTVCAGVLTSATKFQLNPIMYVQLNTRWVELDQLYRLAVPPADSATIKALTQPKAPAEA